MIILLFTGHCAYLQAQVITVNGLVADSATFKSLPSVSVHVQQTSRGAITNDKGNFTVYVTLNDSVIFSHIGFETRIVSVRKLLESPIVYLRQSQNILEGITIAPEVGASWMPKIPKDSPFINPTYTKAYTDTPGLPTMQTFGPSVIIKGIFSRFNKFEKEKRKLPKLKNDLALAENYLNVVNDSVFQTQMMQVYQLNERDFFNLLAKFNARYGNEIYALKEDELISLLHAFFSENKN